MSLLPNPCTQPGVILGLALLWNIPPHARSRLVTDL
jgi:hypothetical protein